MKRGAVQKGETVWHASDRGGGGGSKTRDSRRAVCGGQGAEDSAGSGGN